MWGSVCIRFSSVTLHTAASDRSQAWVVVTIQGLIWGSVCIRFSSVAICTLQHATTEEEADPGTAMNLGSLLSRP